MTSIFPNFAVMKQKVYAFDFDGTITKRDTFVEFLRFTAGTRRTAWAFLLFSPILILMKLRLYPNWKAKQQMFSWFFRGMEIEDFNNHCREFAVANRKLLRRKIVDALEEALHAGVKVIIVSASIENWVKPFFSRYGDKVLVSCTRIDVRDGKITGKFLTKNCYGKEKVKRIDRAFPHRGTYELTAFGDSSGDKAMLDYADVKVWRGKNIPSLENIDTSGGADIDADMSMKSLASGHQSFFGEVLRFALVGIAATLLQIGIYNLLVGFMNFALANTIAYLLSFIFNYFASTRFTFKVKSTTRRGLGFTFAHVVNYLLQTVVLALFIHIGWNERLAQLPMFAICVPVNFILVRFFLTKDKTKSDRQR